MSENRIEKDMIFTENPEEEMWQTILQFSYDANIRRFLIKNSFEESETLINNISGSILQAYEYYKSAKIANLQIKPLLLYYGTTNLLYGITNMLTGRINEIHDHGMKTIVVDDAIFIGDTEVSFNDPDFGGIHVFMNAFNVGVDLSKHGKWNVKETLSAIPELHIDYLKCYDEKFRNNFFLSEYNTPEGKIEKINIENLDIEQVFEMLSNVVGFKENYLSPVVSQDKKFLILRHKMCSENISKLSYSGQPYLSISHLKNGESLTLPQIFYMYIGLFALCSLCRYHPEKWSPFVKNDTTGEKLLIEKFLSYCWRLIPNYIINEIHQKNVVYSNDKYSPIDTVESVGEHQVKKIIEKELLQFKESQRGLRDVFKG